MKIGYLYYDLMNLYGDNGNIKALTNALDKMKIKYSLKLITKGDKFYFSDFDFIYIDGSHQAPDVLYDALLSFRLLRVGGIMVFDDYLWAENIGFEHDPIRCPKPAIDAFTNIYCRKVLTLTQPLYQLYVQKISN